MFKFHEESPLLSTVPKTPRPKWKAQTKTMTVVAIVTSIIFASLIVFVLNSDTDSPTHLKQTRFVDIKTPQGSIRGYILSSRLGRDYYAFHKVPYAKPPLDTLRFKDPQPPDSWNGLRDIQESAPECLQRRLNKEIAQGEEDCLYAHVYTPSISNTSGYPVMVYIHGGWFLLGSGQRYHADYFMDEDVILVTFQHRLGVMGLLNNEDGIFTGNQGFKDQVMLLKWVQANIKSYGGDPTRVTIFGNSAGANAVGYHMLSSMSTGLFHGGITQSCTSLCTKKIYSNPADTVRQVAAAVNCSYPDVNLLQCLQSKDAVDIASVKTATTQYTLTVDDLFLPEKPYAILASGRANKVPYIIGVNNAEGIGTSLDILYDLEKAEKINEDFVVATKSWMGADLTDEDYENVRKFYFRDKKISNETLWNLTNLASDRDVVHCSHVAAMLHSRYSPTYTYYLTKTPDMSYVSGKYPTFPAKELGFVSHADEVQYFLPDPALKNFIAPESELFSFSSYLVRLWVKFASTGNPTLDGVTWTEWKNNLSFWMELKNGSGETNIVDERMAFWDKFTHKQLWYEG